MISLASIILPNTGADGVSLAMVADNLLFDLKSAFDSVETSDVRGDWIDTESGRIYHENSIEFHITADWSHGRNAQRLLNMAAQVCRISRQTAICVRDGFGEVHLIGRAARAPEQVWSEAA